MNNQTDNKQYVYPIMDTEFNITVGIGSYGVAKYRYDECIKNATYIAEVSPSFGKPLLYLIKDVIGLQEVKEGIYVK